MRWGSPRASALASWGKNLLVSVDHRPPTSRAITTRRARRWTPTSSGYVRAFLFRAASRATPSTSAAPLLAVQSPECTYQRCVQRKLCSSKQGKAIRHNFETSSIRALPMFQIKITDHDVGRDSAPCLSANPRQHALQSKPSPPQNSSPRARNTVVATRIKWTATPGQYARSEGEANQGVEGAKP